MEFLTITGIKTHYRIVGIARTVVRFFSPSRGYSTVPARLKLLGNLHLHNAKPSRGAFHTLMLNIYTKPRVGIVLQQFTRLYFIFARQMFGFIKFTGIRSSFLSPGG